MTSNQSKRRTRNDARPQESNVVDPPALNEAPQHQGQDVSAEANLDGLDYSDAEDHVSKNFGREELLNVIERVDDLAFGSFATSGQVSQSCNPGLFI